MRINHNIAALNTYRQLGSANNAQQKSMEKLSSGLRINGAKDDAAGLAISEKMRGQIRGLDMASKNAQDANSLIQTAEGALNETHDILQRMRELAVQASNDTYTESDRKEIQKELEQLTNEIDRIGNTTEFNTQKLLNGDKEGLKAKAAGEYTIQNNSKATITLDGIEVDSNDINKTRTITITRVDKGGDEQQFELTDPAAADDKIELGEDYNSITGVTEDAITINGLEDMAVGESVTISFKAAEKAQNNATKSLSFQIGANSGQNILIGIDDMRADALGLRNKDKEALDLTNASNASTAITTINNAIEKVSAERSKLGATQNRLDHTINNLSTSSENLTAAESRIRDVDMAKEMMEQTKNAILAQASQAMLAQANQLPQGVLQLLR